MSRHAGRLRLLGAAALSCAVSAPFVLAAPALAATPVSSFEAESMGLSTSLGRVNADASASAGKNLTVWANGAAVKGLTTSQAADRVAVRVRGTQCAGAPKMQIKVDGVQILSASVANTAYSEFGPSARIPAGAHKISVGLTNDYRTSSCDRNLLIDKITLTTAAAPAPAPAPSPTPTPEPTPTPTPTPEPAPQGRLIWNGDFSTGNLSQYTTTGGKVQYDTSVDEMRVVDDPVLGGPAAGGRKALKVTVHDSSKDPAQDSPKHRAQAESPKVIGLTDEVYVGYSLLLPNDFPTVHTPGPVTWGGIDVQQASLWEVHGAPYGGSPPMGFRVRDSLAQQRFGFFQGHPANVLRSSQLFSTINPRGRWVDVVAHFKMGSSSSTGFFEQSMNWGEGWRPTVFDNGSTRLNMATAIPSVNGGGNNYSKVSLYYNDNAWPVATVYFAGHKIGTTFDVVSPRTYG